MDSFPDFSRIHSMRSMLAFMRQYRRNYFAGGELYRAFALEKSNKVHDLANEIMKDKSLRAFYDEARSARSQAAANFRQLDPAGYGKMKLEHLRKVANRKNAQEQAKAFTAPWPGTYTLNESIDSLRANSLAKSESSLASKIDSVLELVRNTLLEKNKAYGDSASSPMRIFSKSDADEGIRVRIDDKLSRIAKGDGSGDEDAVLDLIGYLVLLRTRSIE